MKNDGGPAFPNQDSKAYAKGLTKLEWYAGQALVGLLAKGMPTTSAVAASWDLAESMIRERRKRVMDDG